MVAIGLFIGGNLFAKYQVSWSESFYMKAELQDKGVYKIDKFQDENITCYVISGYTLGSLSATNPSISCVKRY